MSGAGNHIDLLKAAVLRRLFRPGLLSLAVNPFHFARKGLYTHISRLGENIVGKTLDIGCGQKPYRDLFRSSCYIGLEIDSPENRLAKKADFFYDGERLPFHDGEFDSAVANQVFEHVFNPAVFMGEMNRVLKPGGMLLMTVPFMWDEHEQPHDYARYSSFGLRAILEGHGFEILEQRKSMDDLRAVLQMLNAYLYKITATRSHLLNAASALLLMAPFNLLGELLGPILPKNQDLYLDNVVLARKVNDA